MSITSLKVFTLTAMVSIFPAGQAVAQLVSIGRMTIPSVVEGSAIYSAGVSYMQTPGNGGGAPQVIFGLFMLTKLIDATSPKLLVSAASGQTFPQATIELFEPGGTLTVLTSYELGNIVVRGSVVKSVPNATTQYALLEEVSLDYGRIKQTVFTPAGPVVSCWDRVANRPC